MHPMAGTGTRWAGRACPSQQGDVHPAGTISKHAARRGGTLGSVLPAAGTRPQTHTRRRTLPLYPRCSLQGGQPHLPLRPLLPPQPQRDVVLGSLGPVRQPGTGLLPPVPHEGGQKSSSPAGPEDRGAGTAPFPLPCADPGPPCNLCPRQDAPGPLTGPGPTPPRGGGSLPCQHRRGYSPPTQQEALAPTCPPRAPGWSRSPRL